MYTAAGLQRGSEFYGPHSRFVQQYGLPPGRTQLSRKSLESQYKVKRVLDAGVAHGGVGGLNDGVDLVEKRRGSEKGQLFVLKRIRVSPQHASVLKREIELLHVLKHPNIVEFIDGYIPLNNNGQAQLVMEYCDCGSLQNLIEAYVRHNETLPAHEIKYCIPEAFLWHIFESLAAALAYIHHGVAGNDKRIPLQPKHRDVWPLILHRDIKPDNIFLKSVPNKSDTIAGNPRSHISRFFSTFATSSRPTQNQNRKSYPKVVLADFGVCTQANEPDWADADSFNGTVAWMSPELPDMTARGEVWSIAAMMVSLCKLLEDGPIKDPEDESVDWNQYIRSAKARTGVRDTYCGSQYTVQLREMIRKCLRGDSQRRPLSWQMLGEIRAKKAEAWFEFEPLPKWVFKKR